MAFALQYDGDDDEAWINPFLTRIVESRLVIQVEWFTSDDGLAAQDMLAVAILPSDSVGAEVTDDLLLGHPWDDAVDAADPTKITVVPISSISAIKVY